MVENYESQNTINIDHEIKKTISDIKSACGVRTAKEKISLLYLAIDSIYEENIELMPLFTDEVTLH